MSHLDKERSECAQLLWALYLREIRPFVWRRAELYALARPTPGLSEDGRLLLQDRRLPEMILDRVRRLDALIEAIGRTYGIERLPPPPRITVSMDQG